MALVAWREPLRTDAFQITGMSDGDDLLNALDQLRDLQERVLKVHHFYTSVWQERIDLYQTIIIGMKLGKRHWFHRTAATLSDYEAEIRRLDVLNLRERRIWTAILANEDRTTAIKTHIVSTLSRIDLQGRSAYSLIDSRALDMLSRLTEDYFRDVAALQDNFLACERRFINEKTFETLRGAFCGLRRVRKALATLQQEYDHSSAAYSGILNTQQALNSLFDALQHGQAEAGAQTALPTQFGKMAAALRPYCDRRNVNMFGTLQQRVSWLLTQQPKIITSTAIRMALFVPFLKFHLGAYEQMGTINLPSYPSISLNLYLFMLSMIALFLEVGPGISKYTIELPAKLFAAIQARTRTADPLGFACPA
jgi:hypothetical protein